MVVSAPTPGPDSVLWNCNHQCTGINIWRWNLWDVIGSQEWNPPKRIKVLTKRNIRELVLSALFLSLSFPSSYLPSFSLSSSLSLSLPCEGKMIVYEPGGWSLHIRKIHWGRKWQPTPMFLPGKSHGQRSLMGYSPWDRESQTWLSNSTTTSITLRSVCLCHMKIKWLSMNQEDDLHQTLDMPVLFIFFFFNSLLCWEIYIFAWLDSTGKKIWQLCWLTAL